jgi:hypothetical protein
MTSSIYRNVKLKDRARLLTTYLLSSTDIRHTYGYTLCSSVLLADLFLYSYEADFIQGLLKKNEKNLARSFNFTFTQIFHSGQPSHGVDRKTFKR